MVHAPAFHHECSGVVPVCVKSLGFSRWVTNGAGNYVFPLTRHIDWKDPTDDSRSLYSYSQMLYDFLFILLWKKKESCWITASFTAADLGNSWFFYNQTPIVGGSWEFYWAQALTPNLAVWVYYDLSREGWMSMHANQRLLHSSPVGSGTPAVLYCEPLYCTKPLMPHWWMNSRVLSPSWNRHWHHGKVSSKFHTLSYMHRLLKQRNMDSYNRSHFTTGVVGFPLVDSSAAVIRSMYFPHAGLSQVGHWPEYDR